jgi:hypothetical protein
LAVERGWTGDDNLSHAAKERLVVVLALGGEGGASVKVFDKELGASGALAIANLQDVAVARKVVANVALVDGTREAAENEEYGASASVLVIGRLCRGGRVEKWTEMGRPSTRNSFMARRAFSAWRMSK